MSTVVATPLAPAVNHSSSPRRFASTTPSSRSPGHGEHAARRPRAEVSPGSADRPTASSDRPQPTQKTSPLSLRNGHPPSIKVKKEPGSPSLPSARPRPKRLDLSSSTSAIRGPQTARAAPLTSRDSAGLVAMHDVGLACLSPGFQTNDPSMREQLQRSLDVRDQQRQIIEARQKGTKPGSSTEADSSRGQDTTLFGVQTRTPSTARRKGPPPGLSIHAPNATQFANDRVIQSAPLHQTFTGLRPGEQPFTRHSQLGPSGLSQTSHIHHMPATQTNNRLPPISDVFAQDRLEQPRNHTNRSPGHTHAPPPVPSPGFAAPQHQQPPNSARAREFRSADEAVHSLSGGRDELMPKVVHYGGVQPPTPPSPLPPDHLHHRHPHHHQQPPHHRATAGGAPAPPQHEFEPRRHEFAPSASTLNGRRRTREEYERDNGSPPSTFYQSEAKRAAIDPRGGDSHREEHDWRSQMSSTEKKEEFLRLCERAWDLFHS